MTRFWLTFEQSDELRQLALSLGCGVTAWTLDDAMSLVRSAFPALPLGSPVVVVENIDVSTLDPDHIRPNMGDVTLRGVWFPLR